LRVNLSDDTANFHLLPPVGMGESGHLVLGVSRQPNVLVAIYEDTEAISIKQIRDKLIGEFSSREVRTQ
jgi:hypothetical protein